MRDWHHPCSEQITNPVAGGSNTDTITYAYDALNRIVGMNVVGQSQAIAYDAISRITAERNTLDSFTYGYSDATPRVTSVTSNSDPSLTMSYYGATGDELLEQISASYGSWSSISSAVPITRIITLRTSRCPRPRPRPSATPTIRTTG
jgi:hypothetical protein